MGFCLRSERARQWLPPATETRDLLLGSKILHPWGESTQPGSLSWRSCGLDFRFWRVAGAPTASPRGLPHDSAEIQAVAWCKRSLVINAVQVRDYWVETCKSGVQTAA